MKKKLFSFQLQLDRLRLSPIFPAEEQHRIAQIPELGFAAGKLVVTQVRELDFTADEYHRVTANVQHNVVTRVPELSVTHDEQRDVVAAHENHCVIPDEHHLVTTDVQHEVVTRVLELGVTHDEQHHVSLCSALQFFLNALYYALSVDTVKLSFLIFICCVGAVMIF